MFSHISVGVRDLQKSLKLYDPIMACLGYPRLFGDEEEGFMAYGPGDCFFIINTPLDPERGPVTFNNGGHICFKADSPSAVTQFYETALSLGANGGGTPGIRSEYAADYYAAFIFDYDGNKLEVLARETSK
ncbi:MAG: VOC family protein [Rhodospirillales bacterium]|nr:VOC family protein [Rhodospirillales bacterium]MCB9980709.1 VOC family protein [Rhodospirillales bacterium]